ncbi:hypothetical protein Tco_0450141, partial [Tanacetum coccineum]
FYTSAGNPVKEILLKLNLPDHRKLKDGGEGNGGNQFRQHAEQMTGNQNGYNAVQNVRNRVVQNAVQNLSIQNVGNHNGLLLFRGLLIKMRIRIGMVRCYNYKGMGHLARNCIVRPKRRDAAYLQTQLLIAQKEEARI